MPVKRRQAKRRLELPEPLQQIVDGVQVEFSDEAHALFVEAFYFGDYPDLPQDALERIFQHFQKWRAECR
jgi:hypothetical protein